jgi:mannose/fructose-specific phosphotransferase system component IIA
MLRALLVTHGDLGPALVATAADIVGVPAAGVEVLSNRDLSREALARAVEERLAAWGGAEGVVLTDLFGGSCTQAALGGGEARPGIGVVCGVNLPMLVDFLVNRGRYGAAEMAARLTDKGRAGVRLLSRSPEPPEGGA